MARNHMTAGGLLMRLLGYGLALCCGLMLVFSAHADDYQRAQTAFATGDYAAARDGFSELSRSRTRDADLLYELARAEYKVGDNKRALETLERVLELESAHAEAFYLLGSVNMGRLNEVSVFRKLGFAKRALKAWEDAALAAPESVRAHFAVFSFYAHAPGMAGGDLESAKSKLPVIERLSESYGHVARGVLAEKAEAFDEAMDRYIRAAAAHDAPSATQFTLARYRLDRDDVDGAREAFARYREMEHDWEDPDETAQLWLDGRIHEAQGNPDRARDAWTEALALNPPKGMVDALKEAIDEL